jgi:photosystem II stability/assembly factor-like uncharacterized protein
MIVTLDGQVIDTVDVRRKTFDADGRWQDEKNHHIGGSIGRTSDGLIYAMLGGVTGFLYSSQDEGLTWETERELPQFGPFTVLADDSFLMASGGGDVIRFMKSSDRGASWEKVSQITREPFDAIHIDGSLLSLRSGTLLMPIFHRWSGLEIEGLSHQEKSELSTNPQYVYRSEDGGKTWSSGADGGWWRTLIESNLRVESLGPTSRTPGQGGTFPNCYETGLFQLPSGLVVAAFRFSGDSRPWHRTFVQKWAGRDLEKYGPMPNKDPNVAPELFMNVMLGESNDGGKHWHDFRPLLDDQGKPVLEYSETNGEFARVPDGRLVLVFQKRYPRYLGENLAKVSEDNGKTWSRETYRINFGFGYNDTLALEDGTLITVTGATPCAETQPASLGEGPGGPPCNYGPIKGEIIRWKLR